MYADASLGGGGTHPWDSAVGLAALDPKCAWYSPTWNCEVLA